MIYMFEYIYIPFHKQDAYEWKGHAFGPNEYKEEHEVEAYENCKHFVAKYTKHLLQGSCDTPNAQEKPQDVSDDEGSFYTAIDSQSSSDDESVITNVDVKPPKRNRGPLGRGKPSELLEQRKRLGLLSFNKQL
jgi:hypothetical protein